MNSSRQNGKFLIVKHTYLSLKRGHDQPYRRRGPIKNGCCERRQRNARPLWTLSCLLRSDKWIKKSWYSHLLRIFFQPARQLFYGSTSRIQVVFIPFSTRLHTMFLLLFLLYFFSSYFLDTISTHLGCWPVSVWMKFPSWSLCNLNFLRICNTASTV